MSITIAESKAARDLESEINQTCGGGVTLALCRHPFVARGPEAAVAVSKSFGELLFETHPDPGKLRSLDRNTALQIATSWLATDLVYGDEIAPPDTVRPYVHRFLALLPDAEIFTNVYGEGKGWYPLTQSTFDAALILLGPETAAILCMQGND